MHRIDGPAALLGGHFSEGDPATGSPATVLTADWAEAVQEELCAVIEGAGLALAKANNAQLLAAIRASIDSVVPVGSVQLGYFTADLPNWLFLDGRLRSRAAYSRLWAWVSSQGLVVSDAAWLAGATGLFSSGDGSTTFRLADLRGEFPRVLDAGRGVDSGRTLGSLQSDQVGQHDLAIRTTGYTGATAGAWFSSKSALAGGIPSSSSDSWNGEGPLGTAVSRQNTQLLGRETRPRSVALGAVIRV